MAEQINLIVRFAEDGHVYATSPQAPGLIYGRPSLDELRADLDDVLAFHFGHSGPFKVSEHHEFHYDVADGELVIRLAADDHRNDRMAVSDRIGQVIAVPEQAKALVSAVTNPVGEAVYVCAVPSDTFGWLMAQLTPPSDALVAALTVADNFLFTLPLAADDATRPAWHPNSFQPDDQLSTIMRRSLIETPSDVTRIKVH